MPRASYSSPESSSYAGARGPRRFFSDTSPVLRLLIGVVFALLLALFIHLRREAVVTLRLGAPSPNYVVAQTAFDFWDKNAAKAAQQGAQALIGPIFQVDERTLRERRLEVEQILAGDPEGSMGLMQAAGRHSWIAQLQSRLLMLRLTDPRTKLQIRDLDPSLGLQVVAQEMHGNRLSPEVLNRVLSTLGPPPVPEAVRNFLNEQFADLPLTTDASLERALRNLAVERVAIPSVHIPGGARLIDKGEVVSGRHQAMLLAMREAMRTERSLWRPLAILSSLIISGLLVLLGGIYLKRRQPELLRSAQKLALLCTILALALGLSKAVEIISLSQRSAMAEVAGDLVGYPFFIPFAVILASILMGSEIALYSGVFLSVLLSLTLAGDPPRFLVLNLIASLVACLKTRGLRRRKDIFLVCSKVWCGCAPYLWAMQLATGAFWSQAFGYELVGTAIALLFTAILVIGLLPLLEAAFHLLTDITLMEYMDPNHELLRRLTIEAPGTYQHSLMVGALAESAANAIGAHGLFCRVAALYHDVGKLIGPHYFTENQQGGVNIHQLLTPLESAQVIIAHVSEGIVLGKRHGLPEAFLNIIREHHGTTLVYYFFCQQLDKVGGYTHLVEDCDFRYPGPKPRTRESAILMIADSLEAAARSLDEMNEVTLHELADRIVQDKAEDGQFDHCSLTFEELGNVKRIMVRTLLVTSHTRIKYPPRPGPSAI